MGEIELGQLLPEFWLDSLSAVATFGKFHPYHPQNQKHASSVLPPAVPFSLQNGKELRSQQQPNPKEQRKLQQASFSIFT